MSDGSPIEPLPNGKLPPPPGTVFEKWWQRSAFHLALFLAILRIFDFLELLFPDEGAPAVNLGREAIKAGRDVAVVMGGAFGLTAVTQGLRRG